MWKRTIVILENKMTGIAYLIIKIYRLVPIWRKRNTILVAKVFTSIKFKVFMVIRNFDVLEYIDLKQ